MVKSRDRVFLEFDQLLNLAFGNNRTHGVWFWKDHLVESAFQSFCRDVAPFVQRSELHVYAKQDWLRKRGFEKRLDITKSLLELLEMQIPLRAN